MYVCVVYVLCVMCVCDVHVANDSSMCVVNVVCVCVILKVCVVYMWGVCGVSDMY